MNRDLRRGLVRALKSSREASLETIISEINKGEKKFTLKEILKGLHEAIQDGLFEMDGGTFRMSERNEVIGDCNPSDNDLVEISECFSDGNESIGDCKGRNVPRDRKRRIDAKRQKGRKVGAKRLSKKCEVEDAADCDSDVLEIEEDLQKSTKVDLRRRRGPRCTSMKKEVKIPSRVHIPWTPRAVPERNQAHNDLLRKSPDPLVGPLFDDISFLEPPTQDLLFSPIDDNLFL